MDPERLLAGLDESQRRAVTNPHRPLAILAPAGSGKTRVLTRRLAWQAASELIDARRALCLSFTREAAGEIRGRLAALGLRELPAAGTFHAIAYALLRVWWAGRRQRPPELLADRTAYLGRLFPELGAAERVRLEAELTWARAQQVGVDVYAGAARAAGRRPPGGAPRTAERLARYEAACRQAHLVDFDDLLSGCIHAFERDAAFAAAQRWRFRHFFVDEFQDVNPLQLQLLRAWLGPSDDVCVVGDTAQAIYGWNGADAGFLEDFGALFPGAEVELLDRNHRSTRQIVAVAAAALGSDPPAGVAEADGPVPTVIVFADEAAEARDLAGWCRARYQEGAGWSNQAVLVRTNALARHLVEGLRAADVPARLLLARPGRSATAGLVRVARQAASLAALEVDAASGALDDLDPAGQHLLAELVREYRALDPGGTPARFAEWLAGPASSGRPSAEVTVATFHAAKGLEWRAVHVAGLEDGIVPAARASGPAARAEERRLLHVALSRATRHLACSRCEVRGGRAGRAAPRAASPFLAEVESACARVAADTHACPPPPALRSTVARLPSSPPGTSGDDTRLAAVLAWREGRARAVQVPAAAVLSDDTAREIARRRPATVDELAHVPGVGPTRADRLGASLLAAVATAAVAAPPPTDHGADRPP